MGASVETLTRILGLVLTLAPQLMSIGNQALAAFKENDQAKLDELDAQVTAVSDTLKPEGV